MKVIDTNNGGRVLDASTHLLSRALVSQSASESWCIKYSVASNVNQTPLLSLFIFLRHSPSFVSVTSDVTE
jgi:hypothetical protein